MHNRPVFEFAIDWSKGPATRFEYDQRELEIGFGPVRFAPLRSDVVRGWSLRERTWRA